MNNITSPLTFTVPLSFEAHSIARNTHQNVTDPKKAKRIYLNTLAVYAVDYYLRCLGFTTDWQTCDSRNPALFKFMDVADLKINPLGKIECRPILPDRSVFEIPAEVWEDRIAYVGVQFDRSLKNATILGFTPTPAEEIPLNQLQSLEDFLYFLNPINSVKTINLRQWIEGVFDDGWQTINELLNPPQLVYGFRNRLETTISRGQKINSANHSFALVINISEETEVGTKIVARLYSTESSTLSANLRLIVSGESGDELTVTSEGEEDFMQLEFMVTTGESFLVKVTSGEEEIIREFTI